MNAGFQWDVFLSHAGADKPRVARLAERLEQAGFRVWFDRASLGHAEDIVAAIENGLERSRVLIFCMTEAAFASEWVRLERNTAIFRDPANNERRFLPLRFEDCTIPALLRRLKYIDWRDESDSAWRELLARLEPGAPPLPALRQEKCNPYDPYTHALGGGFVGRGDELRRLQQALELGHSVSLVGDWRIGKTSLLAAFAERARATGRTVRELTGEGPEGASMGAFVEQVTGRPCPVQPARRKTEPPRADPDAAADQLSEWAAGHQRDGLRPVLVVDEVERLIETFEHRFFERLRGMLSRIMLVLCSRRELDQVYRDLKRTSPFYNTLQLNRLALIESAAVEEMIGWGDSILTEEDGSTVREWAGRHPYFVQLLAYETADARLNNHSIDAAHDRFYDTARARLRDLWGILADAERADLRKAAAGVPAARRSLRLRGLTTGDGAPFGRILREWLTEEQP